LRLKLKNAVVPSVPPEEAPVVHEWSRYTLAPFSMIVLIGEG